ncbi:hypothetical protein [Lactococcus cremoris]|uniref:hypothetical protein n=1 Tax=Lactococcus lactis subsp. cremoris TaxID=1359 RepID=UPI00163B3148|nr:hypothetical protein [Lactococcus cremoris]
MTGGSSAKLFSQDLGREELILIHLTVLCVEYRRYGMLLNEAQTNFGQTMQY